MKTCVNFTAAQVLAALRGEVVTVREAVKHPDAKIGYDVADLENGAVTFLVAGDMGYGEDVPCPYGSIGNALWVRETWYDYLIGGDEIGIIYKATHSEDLPQPKDDYGRWRSSAIMGRDYSRLNVTVQSVAVEQVYGGWEWVAEMVKAQP